MRVILAFLVVSTILIPFFLGGGIGLNALLKRCSYDSQCYDHEVCKNKLCVHACKHEACHVGATCVAENHSASCKCLAGYAHDNHTICRKLCKLNKDCLPSETCMQHQCLHACTNRPCPQYELCKPDNDHSYGCLCDPDRVRDLDGIKCVKPRLHTPICTSHDRCHGTEKCAIGECVNACITDIPKCINENEGCLAENHTATCVCLPKFIRNRRTNRCVPLG